MTPERQSKLFELLATGSDDPLLKAEAALEHISGYLQLEIEDNARLRAALTQIATMADEDDEWDGRDRFRNVREFARNILKGSA